VFTKKMARPRGTPKPELTELTPAEKQEYAKAMRQLRAAYGFTDGLRTDRQGFLSYLDRRRAQDAQARGWS
jgi:hypothetical protein